MKAKFIQKVLAGALAMTLVIAPAVSVQASGTGGPGAVGTGGPVSTTPGSTTPGSTTPGSTVDQVMQIVQESIASGGSTSRSTSSSTSDDQGGGSAVSSIAEIPTTSSVAGVTTTVKGVYIATVVDGSAITTPLSAITAGYGLTAGETPSARIYNMDVKKSPLAAAALNSVAQSIGAVVGPYVNVEIGKLAGGKFSLLPSNGPEITVSFGIPASFAQPGKTFAVACVRPGGAVSILEDTDDNPNTVTFNTTGGQGAYAIIKY